MGTSGDPNDDTRYFDQAERDWQDAMDEAAVEYAARGRWRSIILSFAIIVVAGSVAALMVWGGR